MIKMYIPSRGRADRQMTLEWARRLFDVHLVVREDEYKEYSKVLPAKKLIIQPKETQECIGKIRDFILKSASGCFVMCDDILTIHPSVRSLPVDSTLDGFVHDVEKAFEEYIVFGPNSTFTDGFTKKGTVPRLKPGNVMNLFCINKKKLPKAVHFYFGGYGTWEDGYFNLFSALNGVRPHIFTQWRFKKKFWTPGGCTAMGRTAKMVSEDTALMYSLHPNFIRMKTVRQPSGEQSLYAIIALKKAFRWAVQEGREVK